MLQVVTLSSFKSKVNAPGRPMRLEIGESWLMKSLAFTRQPRRQRPARKRRRNTKPCETSFFLTLEKNRTDDSTTEAKFSMRLALSRRNSKVQRSSRGKARLTRLPCFIDSSRSHATDFSTSLSVCTPEKMPSIGIARPHYYRLLRQTWLCLFAQISKRFAYDGWAWVRQLMRDIPGQAVVIDEAQRRVAFHQHRATVLLQALLRMIQILRLRKGQILTMGRRSLPSHLGAKSRL